MNCLRLTVFLFTKLNKLDIKRIKNLMYDYYSADDITRAKGRIVGNVAKLQIDGFPPVSSRDIVFPVVLLTTLIEAVSRSTTDMISPDDSSRRARIN